MVPDGRKSGIFACPIRPDMTEPNYRIYGFVGCYVKERRVGDVLLDFCEGLSGLCAGSLGRRFVQAEGSEKGSEYGEKSTLSALFFLKLRVTFALMKKTDVSEVMVNKDFVLRLDRTFEHEMMSDVARRLGIPHATVRNYYQGRLPAPEVLIKIANVTNVSLNWLLTGKGDMYGNQKPAVGLGRFIEDKVIEIVDKRLAALGHGAVQDLGSVDAFDVETAIVSYDDPIRVMNDWFAHEGRKSVSDFGVLFFNGWESFTRDEKVAAINDAKRVIDRSIKL